MPRKTHWCGGGAVGVEITPHMIRMLLTLHARGDSVEACRELNCTREALATMVRYVERKTRRALFSRRRGRGGSAWHPLESAQPIFDWCRANPAGGRDYPRT